MDSVRETKPHRAAGSPALCGLKLLCEFSQARAGRKEQEETKKKEEEEEEEEILVVKV